MAPDCIGFTQQEFLPSQSQSQKSNMGAWVGLVGDFRAQKSCSCPSTSELGGAGWLHSMFLGVRTHQPVSAYPHTVLSLPWVSESPPSFHILTLVFGSGPT